MEEAERMMNAAGSLSSAASKRHAKQLQNKKHARRNALTDDSAAQLPPYEKKIPMRQHSLPNDPQALCKRVSWLENFYEILYACQVEGVDVPFTAVYQYSKPYAIYFSEHGQVRKIDSKDIEVPNPAIESPKHSNNGAIHLSKEFMPGPKQESGKKAGSLCKYQTGLVAMRVFARDATLHGDKDLIVEYQTGEDASNFILYRSKEQNGILQKFLQPNTPKVVSYRLYWTPHHQEIEAVSNNHFADAADLRPQRRCCTFDGHQNDISSCSVNNVVGKKITEAASKIVAAVKRLVPTQVEIQVMVLHFKASSNSKVWFLYCSSLRLMDASACSRYAVGASDVETRRRLYQIGEGRPCTAKAEDPQFHLARGLVGKPRRGRVCVLSGTNLGNGVDGRYETTFQNIMTHFLWHGMSVGFAKVGNQKAETKASRDEERLARMHHLSSPKQVRRCLRKLLTGDPRHPLLFVKDSAGAQVALDTDDLLRAAYRLWQDAIFMVCALVMDHLVEDTFYEKIYSPTFLQQAAPVCEDVMLSLSSSQMSILEGWEKSTHRQGTVLTLNGVRNRAEKENVVPARIRNEQDQVSRIKVQPRSASCPPGKDSSGLDEPGVSSKSTKSVKWAGVEEQPVRTFSGQFGLLSSKEALELANNLMQERATSPKPTFFGTMHGSRWRHPQPDPERFLNRDVSHTEYLYWFHLFASIGLARSGKQPPKKGMNPFVDCHQTSSSCLDFTPGTQMTFRDVVQFLSRIELMPSRVSRSSAAHVFQSVNKDHSVNDDEVRLLDHDEFVFFMKKLLQQIAMAERGRIEAASSLIFEAPSGHQRMDKPDPPKMYLLGDHRRQLAVVDHVQLPKIHQYHEVDRSMRYLERKGNIQKVSSYTRDAQELMATSRVARRMLKNPTRTAALGGVMRLDPRALMEPLPSRHQRIPWKPEVVAVQQTLDLPGHGSVVYSSSVGRADLDSAATSVDGEL